MAIRIGKVSRELNVGTSTLVDFLRKRGFQDVKDDLNQKLTDEQYNMLIENFSDDKSLKDEATRFLQERRQRSGGDDEAVQKDEPANVKAAEPAAVKSEEPAQEKEAEKVPEEEPVPDPVIRFKPVGKIDLDAARKGRIASKKEAKPVAEEVPEVKEEVFPANGTESVVTAETQEEPVAVAETAVESEQQVTAVQESAEAEVSVPEPADETEEPADVDESDEESAGEPEETVSEEADDNTGKDEIFSLGHPDAGLKLKTVGKIDLSAINQSTRPKKKSKEEKKKERDAKEQQRQQQRQQFKDSLMKEISKKSDGGDAAGDAKRKKTRVRIGGEKVDISKTEGFTPSEDRPQRGSDRNQKSGQKGSGQGRNSKDFRHSRSDNNDFSNDDVNRQIKDTFSKFSKGKNKSSKYRKEKREAALTRQMEMEEMEMESSRVLKLTEFVTANELATMMNIPVTQVISTCMNIGVMVSINQRLDAETINIVADEYGFTTEYVSVEVAQSITEHEDTEEELEPRAPIVTVMGHVDHGKTSLLDYIRKSNVIAGEAGGITQHIGAYNVTLEDGRHITFLDTPGHEAFTAMRARGAQVTDIAIIIVAADDNVMPQTKEAIAHATAANVPMVFAINKVDKPAADPERIKQELAQMNYLVEDWGGKYQSQDISAKKGTGVPELMEKVLLEAEMLDLKANPNRNATGTIIESSLDKGRGYVATVLVSNGTLKVGDIVIAGTSWGKVKAMFNERNQRMKSARPSEPALILGLNGAPAAGVTFNVVETEREAREITGKREQLQREQGIRTSTTLTLDEIGRRISLGDFHELNLIVKGDVDGSVEALGDSLIKLSTPQVQVNVIHKAVGAISESDVSLAAASNAIIIGFDVRPSGPAKRLAEQQDVDIRIYSIIYDAIDEVKAAMEGLLAPKVKEEVTSTIEVLEVFHISKVGMVAGGRVREGKVQRSNKARLIRDGIVIHTGDILALKRYKDDVREVAAGMDCGISLVGFNDIKPGDMIETFTEVEVKQTL
ncbi:MAG: translation initiation factor IF-2 [Bacteroidaceae bacterium]|nr:translation initiation factor IF-2 [Bacteroidaceae bacterium]